MSFYLAAGRCKRSFTCSAKEFEIFGRITPGKIGACEKGFFCDLNLKIDKVPNQILESSGTCRRNIQLLDRSVSQSEEKRHLPQHKYTDIVPHFPFFNTHSKERNQTLKIQLTYACRAGLNHKLGKLAKHYFSGKHEN